MAGKRGYSLLELSLLLLVGASACGENPRQQGAAGRPSLSPGVDPSSVAAQTADSFVANKKSDSLRATIRLWDGSMIFGYPLEDSLTLRTQYAELRLSLRLVRTVELSPGSGRATISLLTNEELQGTLSFATFPVRSVVGSLSIPMNEVSSIAFLARTSPFDSGLVAFYPFSGNANDASGHGHNGTFKGAVLCDDRQGNEKSACSFDGNDTYVAIPDDIVRYDIPAFSISAWILASNLVKRRIAVYLGASEGEAIVQLVNQQFVFGVNLDTWYNAGSPAIANRWVHIVGVYRRGETVQLWIDGERRDQVPIPNSDLLHTSPTHNSSIGSYAPAHFDHARANNYFSWLGSIDQIRIYNRALEPDEIKSLFALGE